ncbi:MAG TPA: ester cyclase [Pirellulales bacterium]|nr:ester cyclase [Pirellulales bacterium]
MQTSIPGSIAPHGYSMEASPANLCLNRPKTSVEAENKQVVKRIWNELVNGSCRESLTELVGTAFVDRAPLPGLSSDFDGLCVRLDVLHRAFPDFHSTIMDLIAEDDKVVAVVESTGTHRGDFLGMPATGRRFTIQEIQILRILDGKMVEHWQVADVYGMLVQLGFANSPSTAAR